MQSVSRRSLLLGSLALPVAFAQDEVTFSSDVKVVSVLANVLGKHGEIVRNLTKEDFVLLEQGRPQAIKYFSRESQLPLTIGMMVDTSMSQERVLNAERGASLQFLDQVLREGKDKVFIMQFDMGVQMRQELTSSRRQLGEALAFVDTPTRSELRQQSGGGTLLFDALVEAANHVTARQTGRKALITLTDGVDHGSTATAQDAIEAAQRADTLIYSVLFADGGFFGGENGRRPLERMAHETGGGFFEVSKKQTIEQIFAVIEDELRGQYSFGYVSDEPVRISEFRKIALSTKQKGLTVQARTRYWAKRT
jgi:VWFA-related protein